MSTPGLDLGPPYAIAWCPRHLEPFRPRWPAGYAAAMLALCELVFADEEFQELAGHEVERLEPVLREYAPLCCRYEGELERIYKLAGVA